MAGLSPPDDHDAVTALLDVAPLEVTPGRPCVTTVIVNNPGAEEASFALTVVGFEPSWVEIPSAVGPLPPGGSATITLTVDLPAGHPAAHLLGTVTARAVDRRHGGVSNAVASADLVVTVGDGSVLGASLVPPEVHPRRRGRFEVVLQNRSTNTLRVDLTAVSTDEEMRVDFDGPTVVLGAGAESRMAARVSAPRPVLGEPIRRPFGVRVQGRTTPVLLEGSLVQRPYVSSSLFRAVALLGVLALWVAVAIVGISALDTHLKKQATARNAQSQPPVTTPAQPSGTSSGNSGSSPGNSGSSSSSGGSSSGSSSTTTTTPTPKPGGSVETNESTVGTSTVTGKVNGSQPGDATVTLTPASLVDPATQSPTLVDAVSSDQPLGKIPAAMVSDVVSTSASSSSTPAPLSTVSGPDGYFSLSGVSAPGIYQLTIAKGGFGTQQYIVNAVAGQVITRNVALTAGSGSISGSIRGPDGPLGGVSVTITDGTVTLTTRTPTEGNTGSWNVSGLTTPDTYLVEATAPGYSTETTLVTLAAGASKSGVTLTEKAGLGSITGQVTAASQPGGVGGVTVTATNGTQTMSATTTTVAPVGSYSLPNLTIPGTYAVTVSGPGWIPQTQQVQLTGNAVVNANLTSSSSNVTGVVGMVGGGGLPDVGVVLSNDKQTFKTLTQSDAPVGAFSFGQVPPGQYVLSAESFGYTTESSEVSVGPGQTQTVNVDLPYVGEASQATGTVEGSVVDLFSEKPIAGAMVYLDGSTTGVDASATTGYSIPDVTPGVHTITAKAPNHQDTSVTVSVPLGAIVFAPTILMPTLDTVYGTVSNSVGDPIPNPTVTLLNAAGTSPVPGVIYATPPCPTCVPGVPSAADGGFEVDGISQGSYLLEVTGPSQYATQYLPITLSTGAAPFLQNVTLNANPSFTVTTYLTSATASPTTQQGVSVQICQNIDSTTCTPLPSDSATSGPDGVAVILGLQSGTSYTASFSYTEPGSGQSWQALPVTFTAQLNPQPYTAYLTPDLTNEPTVSLKYIFNGVSCTVLPASTSGSGGCPGVPAGFVPPSVSLVGNFYGTPTQGGTTTQTKVPATGPDANGTYSWTSLTGLTPASVSYDVTGTTPTFVTPPVPATSALPSVSTSISLTPNSVPISGTVQSATTGAPITGTTVGVSVSPSSGVSASVNSAGNLVWNQSGNVGQSATPGVYNLTFSASGYDSVGPEQVTVPPCWTSPCSVSVPTIKMSAHITIAVQPQYTAQTGLDGPVVTLTDQTTGTTYPAEGLTGGVASFGGLTPSDTYTYTVAAPGYATYACDASTTCSVSTASPVNGVVTVQPPLSPLGYISGNLEGQINENSQTNLALQGVQVEAQLDAASPVSCAAVPLTATTDVNGKFYIPGDITQGSGGLCPGAIYDVKLVSEVAGYPFPSSTTRTIDAIPPTSSQFDTQADLTLQAQAVSFAFYLVDDQSPTPSPVSTASVVASSAVAPSVTLNESPGPNGQAEYSSSSLFPTAYTFNVSEAGYAPLAIGPITFPAGYIQGTTINTYALGANRTINGTAVTPTAGTPSTVPLGSGVTVNLLNHSNGDAVVATTTTGAGGTFSFSLLATGLPIPNGSYRLSASLTGYTGVETAAFTTTNVTTVQNVTLTANPVSVPVTVTSTIVSDDLSSATVTLTKTAHPSTTAATCTATSALDAPQQSTIYGYGQGPSVPYSESVSAGVATFPQVVPDYYTLTVDPGTGHPSSQSSTLIYVCPDASGAGKTYTSPSPTFEVQEGLVTGTVTAATSVASASVTVTATTAGTVTNPTINCSGTCLSGTYSEYVPLGDSYAVGVSLAGYQPASSPSPPPVLSATSATDTFSPVLTALSHTVTLHIHSGGSSPFDVQGATVSLSSGGVSYPAQSTTNSDGITTVDSVPPGTYDVDVSWIDPVTSATTFSTTDSGGVEFGPMANDPSTFSIAVAVAAVTGSATLSNPLPTSAGTPVTYYVNICGTACTNVYTDSSLNDIDTTNGVVNAPTILLAPGTYQLTATATGYSKITPVTVTLGDGNRTTASTIVVTN